MHAAADSDHYGPPAKARTRNLGDAAIDKFENSPRTKFANQLQPKRRRTIRDGKKPMLCNEMRGAPEEIRTPDPQIRSLIPFNSLTFLNFL